MCLYRKIANEKKQIELSIIKNHFLKQALNIFRKKVHKKKPEFTARKRSKVYGSGKFDLNNEYIQELYKEKLLSSKLVVHQDKNNPIQGIEVDGHEGEEEEDEEEPRIVINEEASDNEGLFENLSNSSLPTHISEIEETEPLNVKEFIKDMRDKYKKLNLENVEDRMEIQKEDPTQYPLYVKLNKLRKMREENAKKVVIVKSTDVLKSNSDNFDKFMKKMIKENLEMANPGSYEGIFFKSNEDYVKFMKGKYTAKVDTLNIDKLWEKLGATYPRFKRDTNSRLIKSLRVTSDEYKCFEQYLLTHQFREIQNQEICLFEFVVEKRLRDTQLCKKKSPLIIKFNTFVFDKHKI